MVFERPWLGDDGGRQQGQAEHCRQSTGRGSLEASDRQLGPILFAAKVGDTPAKKTAAATTPKISFLITVSVPPIKISDWQPTVTRAIGEETAETTTSLAQRINDPRDDPS